MRSENGYSFAPTDFAELLIRRSFPEVTDRESGVLRDYLLAHLREFSSVTLRRRVGVGVTPDPDHLPGVQAQAVRNSQKAIDLLAMKGDQPVIVEAKERVTPAALGQIQTYSHLYREEFPNAPDPELIIAGRYSDDDTIRACNAAGVAVILYPLGDVAPVDDPRRI